MIFNVIRKELKSLFSSPMGWVVLALLQLLFGIFFFFGVNNYLQTMSGAMRPEERLGITEFVGNSIFGFTPMLMLFAVPLLSMRLLSDERRQQTLTFLLTAPLTLSEIVVGKFLGLVFFLAISVVIATSMLVSLNLWADLDFGYILSNFIGVLLLVASFSALGLYVSSLTQQPVVSAIVSFIAMFSLLLLDFFFAGDNPTGFAAYLSVVRHFEPFSRGVLDTKDVAYFLLFIITFLTLTVRRLDADRLRG
jgi:ABC-2 type transport system permease protein